MVNQNKKCVKTGDKREKKKFSDEDRIKLAGYVKGYPALWDISNQLYKKTDAHQSFWEIIAGKMSMTVEECRTVWKSLRDGLRYRVNGKKQGKSGDAAGDEESDSDLFSESLDNTAVEGWALWDSMKFVLESKMSKKTLSTPILDEGASESPNQPGTSTADKQGDSFGPQASSSGTTSNYSYVKNTKRRNDFDEGAANLLTGITDLVNMRKQATESLLSKNAKPAAKRLKYISMYSNLDRMLKKLPETVVEDLNLAFVQMVHSELKKNETSYAVEFEPVENSGSSIE